MYQGSEYWAKYAAVRVAGSKAFGLTVHLSSLSEQAGVFRGPYLNRTIRCVWTPCSVAKRTKYTPEAARVPLELRPLHVTS